MADARVFVNNGTGTLAAGPTLTGVTGITSVLLVDTDGDRKLDIVLGGTTVALFKNIGDDTAAFAAAASLSATAVTALAAADLDATASPTSCSAPRPARSC